MPGLAGIIGPGIFSTDGMSLLDEMVKSMIHEKFYQSQSYRDAELKLHVAIVSKDFDAPLTFPYWNDSNDAAFLIHGETFNTTENSGPADFHGLLNVLEDGGGEIISRLNGNFCGLLIDKRRGKVSLFNDRFGLQRLYIYENDGTVYFASEAKALLRIFSHLRSLDHLSLAEYLVCGCALRERTLFSGISLLPAGSYWTLQRNGTLNKKTYFSNISWSSQPELSSEDFYHELQSTFKRVLPRYLSTGSPLAMSLTGGLDGRMIMAYANKPPGALPCYTFGGPFRDCTDVTLARTVAGLCSQSHKVISIGNDFLSQFSEFAQRSIYISDGAMDVTGAVELYANKLARQIAPFRLTGNYGSEILRSNVAFKPQPLNPTLFKKDFLRLGETACKTYGDELNDAQHPLSFIAFKQVPWHHCSRFSVEQSQVTLRSPYLDNELVALAFRCPRALSTSKIPALRLISEGCPPLGKIPTDRGLLYKPARLRGKIANTYQEFMFKAEYAYDYGMPQWLAQFDRLLAPLELERLFLGRHKFYHFRTWYKKSLSKYLQDTLLDSTALNRPHLEHSAVEQMVSSHIKGSANYTTEIHQLLSVELIYRTLLDPVC
jgi:asparagine synthase (glutamine-hydrolysing)